ncbi:MAG: hypothetical protein CSA62_10245 [Planctomycetota bacterium]|nr:MAG: hypothetical protein CSA62_10245 [Planctomycetota bacterium]
MAPYRAYSLLASLYLISKIIYFSLGFICFGGLLHGLAASAATLGAAFFASRGKAGKHSALFHWLMVLFPLLILPLTPSIMMFNLGDKILVSNKVVIFVIWELIAGAQVLLAFAAFGQSKALDKSPA